MTQQRQLFRRIRHLIGIGILTLAVASMSSARAQNATATPRTAAQTEQLVAPIALYPDALLSQVLMASTYPLEVVAAARWSQANPNVTGDALKTAMEKQTWDPSVKALTAIPQTLQMMNDKLDWTQQLGDTFLAQQGDVLDAVQRLRARADANGQLKSTPQQTVTTASRPAAPGAAPATPGESPVSAPATIYTIEPTNPDEYYVPIYDPGVVYGDWPYPDYAPFYWYPPGWTGSGYGFAAGVLAGSAIWGGVNWLGNRVQINPLRYNNFNRTNIANGNWTHNPAHRGGVPYRDAGVAQRFGNQGNAAARDAFRGTAEAGRRDLSANPGANRPGQNRPGNTTTGNNRPGNTTAGNNRPGNAAAGNNKAGNAARTGAANNKAANNKAANNARTGAGNKGAGGQKAATAKNTAANKNRNQATANKRPANNQARSNGAARTGQAARPSAGPSRSAGARSTGGARSANARAGGGARGGGGRRSDLRLKHDVELLGYLDNGIGFYRFSYNGSSEAYVGVIAQEVQAVMPQAVVRGRDGYLRVFYDRLGLTFQTYQHWIEGGARVPSGLVRQSERLGHGLKLRAAAAAGEGVRLDKIPV